MILKTNIKYIVGLILLINLSVFAQEKKCSDFKTGNFKYSKQEYKKYKVVRYNSIQIETDTITGVKMEGTINWKSDCEYELTYTKVSDPKYAKAIGQKLKVEIIKITGNTILCKSEGGGITLEIEMTKND
jgi:hypothetical protein